MKMSVLKERKKKRMGKEMAIYSSILVGKSHRQRRLVGYSLWGHKESDRN